MNCFLFALMFIFAIGSTDVFLRDGAVVSVMATEIDETNPNAQRGSLRRQMTPVKTKIYNKPGSASWPSKQVFYDDLDSKLSTDASLKGPFFWDKTKYFRQCLTQGLNPFAISSAGDGICMQTIGCAFEFCQIGKEQATPAYAVDVRTPQDIAEALKFANMHNIEVSVKSTGHSITGASMARDSLLISMYNYPKDDTIIENYSDSCSTTHGTVISVGGGETFTDVVYAVKDQYNYVTGSCNSVGASGGFLMGGGLSVVSRKYGMAIDNVVDFDIVLADGTELKGVDACNHPDLFWALRGGGGGTFGVVTGIHYKLHPVEPIIQLSWFWPQLFQSPDQRDYFKREWLTFWIEKSPHIDNRWGGYWNAYGCQLYFVGTEADAMETFVDMFDEWYEEKGFASSRWIMNPPSDNLVAYTSYHDYKGGDESYYNPAFTIPTGFFKSFTDPLQSARLLPYEVAVEQKEEVIDLLFLMSERSNPEHLENWFLGGAMMERGPDDTAVHPAMRRAVAGLHTYDPESYELLRNFLPDGVSGASFNHHNVLEPNWREALWGLEHYERLLTLKEQYDPNNVFNCWHCVGYQGEELVS